MVFAFCLLVGCGQEPVEENTVRQLANNEIYIYYLNIEKNDIYPEPFVVESQEEILLVVDQVVKALKSVDEEKNYLSPFPQGITYRGSKEGQRSGNVELNFDVIYDGITSEDMLFFKACVSKSIMELEGVHSVTMYFTDLAATDEETATISESFEYDSFNLIFGEGAVYTQQGSITVYFANESGDALKGYNQVVEITNTTSLPQLVLETLINGPKDDEVYTATLAKDVQIQKVNVKDGICYVDLSDEFYNSESTLSNDIIVYSIVNSLVDLPNVSKVQFLRNGEKQTLYRESLPFDGLLERNLDLIEN